MTNPVRARRRVAHLLALGAWITFAGCGGGGGGSAGGSLPTPPTLVSIAVSPAGPSTTVGTSVQFVATGTYSDASTQTLTKGASWTSSEPGVATIGNAAGNAGLASALAVGSTAITATLGAVQSPAATLQVTAAPPVQAIKFHPGWYIALDPNNNTVSSWIAKMHSLKGTPNLVGFFLIQNWKWFEPAQGVYGSGTGDSATGTAALDQLLAEAAADGFQFMVGLEGKAFGSTPCSGNCGIVPDYFDTLQCADGAPGYLSGTAVGGTTFSVKSYDPAVTARYILLLNAYGQRYDANPNFEMFRDATESANSLFTAAQLEAMPARYIAWAQAARLAFPSTNLSLSTNFLHSAVDLATLFAGVVPYGVFIGGPDTKAPGLNTNYVPGNGNFDGISNIVFNGYIGANGMTSTAIDYRGKLGWIAETQTPEETYNQQSPQDTYNAMFGVTAGVAQGAVSYGGDMQPQYFIFSLGFFQPNSWTQADVTSFISGAHPVNTTAPASMLAQP